MPFPNQDTMFKPGQSADPTGRPRNLIGEALRSRLGRLADHGRPMADHLAEALLLRALQGDVGACKVIFDRIDGKVAAAAQDNPGLTTILVIHATDNEPKADSDPRIKTCRKGSTPDDH